MALFGFRLLFGGKGLAWQRSKRGIEVLYWYFIRNRKIKRSKHIKALADVEVGKWDEAHRLVQSTADRYACLIHCHLQRVAGDLGNARYWYDRGMPDDPVVATNVRGAIAFAFTEPGTRSTQVYINMVDNTRLDAQGFAPFGMVVRGMDSVVDSIYSGYGEDSGGGVRRGNQALLVGGGNAYLDEAWPELDRILRMRVRPLR